MSTLNAQKPGRRRRNRAQRQRIVTAQAASNLSQQAYCARHGLSYSSFCRWKRELNAVGSSMAAPGPTPRAEFVELKPLGLPAPACWEFELELGDGVTLRMRRV